MPAFIRGDVEVDSTAFSCSSCHLRAGLGSFEGGVVTPPTTGSKLYKPYRRPPSLGDTPDRVGRYIYARTVQERPAYTRESLATSLRFGTDPAGQVFNDVMPRYPLNDRDMSIMIAYLEHLSSEASPGATPEEFSFATIISDDVSQEDRQALLGPLQSFIDEKNQQLELYRKFIQSGYVPTLDMKDSFRKASLDIWELKGPSGTWQAQLSSYYRTRPVFAVLGGISNQEWRPVHDFCEAERLPCLFPITDFPVVSDNAWYTYYFNKGLYQEGEAVGRYLSGQESVTAGTSVLQVVQDSPAGRALQAGFQKGLNPLQPPVLTTVTRTADQLRDRAALASLLTQFRPEVLLLWTDAGLITHLPDLTERMGEKGSIFVSSGYLGKKTTVIAESVRSRVFISYPYRLSPYVGGRDGVRDANIPMLSRAGEIGDRRVASRTTTMLTLALTRGLNLIYDNLYRDHLLDVMSMQMDLIVRDYERLSFGPGQRYASKGCYIIQLGPGPEPALLQKSGWVIQ